MFVITGIISGVVPIYICELAPIELRGKLGVLHQFSIAVGMLSAYVSQLLAIYHL